MSLSDVHAVVASARARGTESLERLIRRRDANASDVEVTRRVAHAVRLVEELPPLLERASEQAEGTGMEPILQRAEEYLLRPVDFIPEMTQGLAGLLDDAYFVLHLVHALGQGPHPLLPDDLTESLAFLRHLIGEEVALRLDQLSLQTIQETEAKLRDAWDAGAAEA